MNKPQYKFSKYGRIRLAISIGVVALGIYLIIMLSQSIPTIIDAIDEAQVKEETLDTQVINGIGIRAEYNKYSMGNDVYYVYNITLDSTNNITNAFARNSHGDYYLQSPIDLATDAGAVIAINTDYYPYNDGGIMIRNGELYEFEPTQRDMLLMHDDLTLSVVNESEFGDISQAQKLVDDGVINSYSAGPTLVLEGEVTGEVKSSDTEVTARTGIGMIEPGKFTVIVCDGLSGSAPGMTLEEFAMLFENQGCSVAYALSDDSNSFLYVNGEVENNNAGRVEPRMVGDILCFKEDIIT